MLMKKNIALVVCCTACMVLFACGGSGDDPLPSPTPTPEPIPTPSGVLYNGITLPATWPPHRAWSSNVDNGMSPYYLSSKPSAIDISVGRQLFVDNFLISSTTLIRKFHYAEYYSGNPVLAPSTGWEKSGTAGGGFAAPFSDGVWYDETDSKFKMWYMGAGGEYGNGNFVTCYAESADGINWVRPTLSYVSGTNIIYRNVNRDSNSVWLDKQESNSSRRYKMFMVSGGAGNWRYHYFFSSDGKAWRESAESGLLADRSTVYKNPFRSKWIYSMRHNVRVDASNLVRARDYHEDSDPVQGTKNAVADLQKFWFGPWPGEATHTDYPSVKPAVYNLDATPYESIMLGLFSIWQGPENDVCVSDNVVKRNQIMLGYSRDGYSWHRQDPNPFLAVNTASGAWNNGNLQSAIGSPLIVDDKLYFYLSGRRLNENNAEVTSTGLAMLRRDGFASMQGTGQLETETLKFTGSYLFVNASVTGSLKVEVLDSGGNVLSGFSAAECVPFAGDATKTRITWSGGNDNLSSLAGTNIRLRFQIDNGEIFSFWITPDAGGKSYGYTAGGGQGFNSEGIDK